MTRNLFLTQLSNLYYTNHSVSRHQWAPRLKYYKYRVIVKKIYCKYYIYGKQTLLFDVADYCECNIGKLHRCVACVRHITVMFLLNT